MPQSRGSPKSLVLLSRRALFASTALAGLGKMQAKACLEVFLLGGAEQVLKVAPWCLSPTRPLRVACRLVAVALKAPRFNSPPPFTAEIKPAGFVYVSPSACQQPERRVTKHVVTAVLVVAAA